MPELLPLFLNVTGRQVVLVGGGRVAAAKLRQLLAVGARVRVIAPEISNDLEEVARPFQGRDRGAESPAPQLNLTYRPFAPSDLDDAWLVTGDSFLPISTMRGWSWPRPRRKRIAKSPTLQNSGGCS